MSEKRSFPAKVIEIINNTTIVINRGSSDNVKEGDIFLIYCLGKEIIDPDTKESYGKLEIVRGQAVVEHIQERMSTLKSCKTTTADKKIIYKKPILNNSIWAIVSGPTETKEEIIGNARIMPFNEVKEGDFAKPI